MTSDADAVQKLLEDKASIELRIGTYVGVSGGRALVDVSGSRVTAAFRCEVEPGVNESVWVETIDGSLFVTGPTVPKPGIGTVVSLTDPDHALLSTTLGEVTAIIHDGDELDADDIVGITWPGLCCYKLATSPDDATPGAAPPSSSGGVQTAEFRATDSGSTDRGSARWWTTQVYASSSTYGAWVYGSTIKDTIPAAAAFASLQIYISWVSKYGAAPRLVMHNLASKSGVPGVSGYTEWTPGSGYQTPPNAEEIFNGLKAGGAYYGIGFDQGGKNVFKSLAADGMSGALKIQWT